MYLHLPQKKLHSVTIFFVLVFTAKKKIAQLYIFFALAFTTQKNCTTLLPKKIRRLYNFFCTCVYWPLWGWGHGLAPFQLGRWTRPFPVGEAHNSGRHTHGASCIKDITSGLQEVTIHCHMSCGIPHGPTPNPMCDCDIAILAFIITHHQRALGR